jgi:hypothetical protein
MCRVHLYDPDSEIVPYRIYAPKTKHAVVAIIQRNGIPSCGLRVKRYKIVPIP